MNCQCIGSCGLGNFDKLHTIRRTDRHSFRLGYSRCRVCEFYIMTKGVYCPCCQGKLAKSPRNAKAKRLLNEEVVRY